MRLNIFRGYIQYLYTWLRHKLQRTGQWLSTILGDNKRDGKNTIAVLDGVRGCAIIFVLTFHINRVSGDNLWSKTEFPLASSVSTAGGTGVTLFFVLSGFLLFLPFAKSLLFQSAWPSARIFYLRRVFRIVPAYYVSLLLLIVFSQPDYLRWDHLKDLILFLTFFMDSTQQTFRQINGPFWTLAIEWQFYMFLPLLSWGISRLVRRVSPQGRLRALIFCLIGVIAWGLCQRYAGLYFTEHPTQTFLVPRSVLNVALFFLFGVQGKYLEDFAVGMLVSLCYVYAQQPSTDNKKYLILAQRLSPWLWSGGILLLLFGAMWHFNFESHGWPLLDGLKSVYLWLSEMGLSIGYGACIAAILFGSAALKRPFEWLWLRWIGLISYSLYIWHLPLIIVLKNDVLSILPALDRYTSYAFYWLWALLIILPFALLSFVLVEKPWMGLGDQWRRKIEQSKKT